MLVDHFLMIIRHTIHCVLMMFIKENTKGVNGK